MNIFYHSIGVCALGYFAFAGALIADINQVTSSEVKNTYSDDFMHGCIEEKYFGHRYTICRFEVANIDLQLTHLDQDGELIGTFANLEKIVTQQNQNLIFAMNAGMYDPKFNPVGLYVEKGETKKTINTRDGYGNFHLKPNGIFYLVAQEDDQDGRIIKSAGVKESTDFIKSGIDVEYATQSGPMLVIDGKLHPRFNKESQSRRRRNGVGVSEDGRFVSFAISDGPVTFHEFGSLFLNRLKTPQALFLDGSISKLFLRELDRHDKGLPMGPMIVITAPEKADLSASQ